MPDLSAEQFHEHLEAFRERLGLEFHPNVIEFAGKRFPTVHQHVTLSGIPGSGLPLGRQLRSTIAPEHGRFHSMDAWLPSTGHHSGQHPAEAYDRLAFDSSVPMRGGAETTYRLYMPRAPHNDPSRPGLRDPARFVKDVTEDMRQAALEHSTPHDVLMKMNKESLKEWAPSTGKIQVEYQVFPKLRDSRWYHFHVGSGSLERVEPPARVQEFYERRGNS